MIGGTSRTSMGEGGGGGAALRSPWQRKQHCNGAARIVRACDEGALVVIESRLGAQGHGHVHGGGGGDVYGGGGGGGGVRTTKHLRACLCVDPRDATLQKVFVTRRTSRHKARHSVRHTARNGYTGDSDGDSDVDGDSDSDGDGDGDGDMTSERASLSVPGLDVPGRAYVNVLIYTCI